MQDQEFKRHIAYKYRIGELLAGKPTIESDRFKFLEIDDKKIIRVNIIANVTDKFVQEGEKKYATLTIDDASGQIRVKSFGDEIQKLVPFVQGDTLQVIGLLRTWNNELYLTPEIIVKKDPSYLLIRKLEVEATKPKKLDKNESQQMRDSILTLIKENDEKGGIDVDSMKNQLQTTTETVNQEIKKLLEEGMIYEPRPGKLRYLG
jgi:RPA family protein